MEYILEFPIEREAAHGILNWFVLNMLKVEGVIVNTLANTKLDAGYLIL
jgi:hypothetical protein